MGKQFQESIFPGPKPSERVFKSGPKTKALHGSISQLDFPQKKSGQKEKRKQREPLCEIDLFALFPLFPVMLLMGKLGVGVAPKKTRHVTEEVQLPAVNPLPKTKKTIPKHFLRPHMGKLHISWQVLFGGDRPGNSSNNCRFGDDERGDGEIRPPSPHQSHIPSPYTNKLFPTSSRTNEPLGSFNKSEEKPTQRMLGEEEWAFPCSTVPLFSYSFNFPFSPPSN